MIKIKGIVKLEIGNTLKRMPNHLPGQMFIESGGTTVKFYNRTPRKLRKALKKHRSTHLHKTFK